MSNPLASVYHVAATVLALAGGALSVLLLTVSHTQGGTLFGTAALILSLVPLMHCITSRMNSDFLSWMALLLFAGAVGIGGWLFYTAPNGHAAETARVQNRYVGQWKYPRTSLGSALPELDQLRLGLKLAPLADRQLTRAQADRATELTTGIYDELEADPEFHALGSVLTHAYTDLWSETTPIGHYFLYIPKRLDRAKPAPLMIFLHGSGGNFKAYTWLLSKVADDLGMVLIAPSFGLGTWDEPQATQCLTGALNNLAKVVAIDSDNRHLIGLSNGGLGVCRAGSHLKGGGFRSFIFISPVMDLKVPALPAYAEQWRDHPALILTGEKDDRVPLDSVKDAAAQLQAQQVRVTLETYADADHFLLFTHREQALKRISQWLQQTQATAQVN
jgi:predicted esterase